MKHYTVMVFPDRTSPVRRFKVSRKIVHRSAYVLGFILLAMAATLLDYVRVRGDVKELERLRAEAVTQRERVQWFDHRLEEVEGELARISEFERKVRVIADLPGAPVTPGVQHLQPNVGGLDNSSSDGEEAKLPDGPAGGGEGDELAPVSGTHSHGAHQGAWHKLLGHQALELEALASARASSLEDLVDALHGKSHRLASTPSIWPTKGWLSSDFGRRISPFTGKPQFHGGIDIAAEPGTEILAPARGRVIFVGRKGPLGTTLTVDHGFGVHTSYGHLSAVHVKKHEEVERGQWIASVGNTGRSTGPHLHYAVSVNGKAVNPRKYILE